MSVYEDLRDKVYDSLFALFPTTPLVNAYSNGPEEASPYIVFDLSNIKQEGQEYVSTHSDVFGTQQIVQTFTFRLRLEFVGEGDDFTAASLAEEFYRIIDYTPTNELFQRNGMSYFRKSSIRKVPKKRETDWWMFYQVDLYFGYQVEARQDVGAIESVEIEGDYGHFQQTIQIP